MKHFVLAVVTALVGCSCGNMLDRKAKAAGYSRAIPVIESYVALHRHWRRSEYRIEEYGVKGECVVYDVIYRADEKPMDPHSDLGEAGGGQSFAVLYQPVTQKIVKEMHFE